MKGKLMEKAFRANIHGITPDCYLWTNPIPERIVHYSKQRDPKGPLSASAPAQVSPPASSPPMLSLRPYLLEAHFPLGCIPLSG
ncbi:unnamed protein product [Arctogadus glacialis]